MNRGRRAKQLRKYITKYAVIRVEYSREPDRNFTAYRKGSYEVTYSMLNGELSGTVGDISKYAVYKTVARDIREHLK